MRKIVSFVMVVLVMLSSVMVFTSAGAVLPVGDLNGDGFINIKDCNLMKRYNAGVFELEDKRLADIDGDGAVNNIDSNLLRRAVLGIYTTVQPIESDGVSISGYTVVYPEKATVYETYAVEILCDYVSDNFGYELTVCDDTAPETQYEILVGATNRAESTTEAVIGNNQYLVQYERDKIVLQGKDYMIGGAVGELTYKLMTGDKIEVSQISQSEEVRDYTPETADSVILMIGDGMGFNHIKFTRSYYRLPSSGKKYSGFIAEKFPNAGESTTRSITDMDNSGMFGTQVTDSAAGATALATGWKTQNGKLGLNGFGLSVQSVRELAHSQGKKTAVVSTEVATGATPSGFTVHLPARTDKEAIAAAQKELVESGGITYLAGGVYDELLDETKKTLDIVSTDSDGFYVMIEEAYIDKAVDSSYAGGNSAEALAGYVYRFNTAIQYAATFTASRPGTVLIITADHETGNLSALTGLTTNNGHHTDLNVPVFAMGAGTEIFNDAVVDNTDIAKFTAKIFGAESFGGSYTNIRQ